MRKVTLLLLVTGLAVVLIGCPSPTAAPTSTPIPAAATDTPVPEPAVETATPEPVATDTPVPAPTDTPQPVATDTPVPAPTDTPQPAVTMQVLLIIAPQNFQPQEYSDTRRVLEEGGYTAVVASTTLEEAVSMPPARTPVKPDVMIGDVVVADYDAIIFIGGSGASVYWDDPIAHRIAQEAVAQEKVLAAICIAPATLAKAGVLQGKQATVFPSPDVVAMVQEGGATCTGEEPVVRDGLIVTGNGPGAATEFGETILAVIQGQ